MKSLFLLLFFSAGPLLAAPLPATSTSALTDPTQGLYLSGRGYTLKTEGTDWQPVASSGESLMDTLRFAPPEKNRGGSLSVRTDRISARASLESYVKRFMRDYPNYGFDVLGSKAISVNQSPGLVVDMVQRTKNKQIRQVVLKKEHRIAILTCMDDKERFLKETIADCNQLIKSFEWREDPHPAPTDAADKVQ